MENFQTLLRWLPAHCRAALYASAREVPEEIRFRVGKPPTALFSSGERPLGTQCLTQRELEQLLSSAIEHSCYAVSDKLREGFVTLAGGHRLGVCGTAVVRDGRILSIRDISSLCLRIARPIAAAPDGIERWLDRSTLIIGAPGCGKTTLLRDCIRRLSDFGRRVGVVDARGEIAACMAGVPQMDVGRCTDVLCGCKKGEGMMLLLRSMNPQWIAVDEITEAEDILAIEQCAHCGVRLLATAHAACAAELSARPLYRRLLALGVFEKLLVLDREKHVTMERVV